MQSFRFVIKECALGRGVFAAEPIPAQHLILTMGGTVLSRMQVARLGSESCYPIQVGATTYFDPTPPGRFLNHSCNPNAGLRHDHHLISLRDIAPGEEICFDYSTTMSERWWTMACRCGQVNCRGVVRDFHDLPAAVQSSYLRQSVVQKFIVAEHHAKKLAP